MRFLSLVALGAFALALSTIGCSADATEDAPAASSDDVTVKRQVIATEADEGTTVQVTEGDTFVLKLGSNPTTGYQWKVTRTDRTFAYPFADDFEGPGASGPVGSGGTQILKWSTDAVSDAAGTPVISKVGKHTIIVEYRRSFEPASTPAVKTYKIMVEVVAPTSGGEESQCGDHVCGPGTSCQFCWGSMACIPNGAMC